jgi:catechol 2,3-dioxygenase-like lactoylglutathione lyase family enzyme
MAIVRQDLDTAREHVLGVTGFQRIGGCDVGRTTHTAAMQVPAPLADVMITLGARDLSLLRDFYRSLGWPQIIDEDNFAAFELRGVVLALFPIAELARDGNTEPDLGNGGIRFSMGIMVNRPAEVDQLTEQMRNAGARVTKEPVDAEFFAGRSAYLCDPEGNYFEITWAEPNNPITSRRAVRV